MAPADEILTFEFGLNFFEELLVVRDHSTVAFDGFLAVLTERNWSLRTRVGHVDFNVVGKWVAPLRRPSNIDGPLWCVLMMFVVNVRQLV